MRHESVINRILSKVFGTKIAVRETMFYEDMKSLIDFQPDDIINLRAAEALSSLGSVNIYKTVISAGTAIPYYLNTTTYDNVSSLSNVVTKVIWNNPSSGTPSGQLYRVYDIPVIDSDTNNDGTGTFNGFNVYGHDDGTGHFLEQTTVYISSGENLASTDGEG